MKESHLARVRQITRLLRSHIIWPETEEEVLQWYDAEWFKSPHWRLLISPPVHALKAGNPGPARKMIDSFGFSVLADPVIQEILKRLWLSKSLATPEGELARQILKRLLDGLWDPYGRPEMPQQEKLQHRKQSVSVSKAKARWLKKFEHYKPTYGAAKARKQVLMEFDQSPYLQDSSRKTLIRQELARELNQRVRDRG